MFSKKTKEILCAAGQTPIPLTSLEGLHNIKTVGSLQISGNAELSSLEGLRGVETVEGNLKIGLCTDTWMSVTCAIRPAWRCWIDSPSTWPLDRYTGWTEEAIADAYRHFSGPLH